jgi:3-hydroxyacyl-[acyl-carrier-protein] dehydratase
MDPTIARLPHRPPFLFVDEVVANEGGTSHCAWQVRGDEAFLRGHFPGRPLVPGVLITEALAQAAGIAVVGVRTAATGGGMLVQADVRFRKPVVPPARIELHATEAGGLGTLTRFTVAAKVDGTVVADGTLVLAILEDGSAGA